MKPRKISRGPSEFINIIHKVAELYGITDIDYVIHFGCEDVDYYVDGLYKVHMKGYRDGQKVKKIFIVKWHSDSKMRLAFREAYKRECLLHKTIVPKLLEVQRKNLIEGLKMKFPNCDYCTEEEHKEAIVISDQQYEGFRFHHRLLQLNLDHVAIVLKNLAKLHALSFAFEQTQPGQFEEIKKKCYVDMQYPYTKLVPKPMATYYNASVSLIKDPILKKKMLDLGPCIMLIMNKCTTPRNYYCTLCHGDCWNNNVLYKYQKDRPVDLMFVDYHQIRYSSPVTDISYYLYMSTDENFLSEHYDRVISLYYSTLCAVLRQCNLDPGEIYPQSVFDEHLRLYSVFGLIEALISMKIITAVPEEAIKMTEEIYIFGKDGLGANESKECQLHEQRVNGVVKDFFSRDYSLNAVLST